MTSINKLTHTGGSKTANRPGDEPIVMSRFIHEKVSATVGWRGLGPPENDSQNVILDNEIIVHEIMS